MRRALAGLRRAILILAGGLGVLVLVAGLGLVWLVATDSERWDARPASHVMIYLAPPILTEGGAVIVAGRSLPEDAWRRLPAGRNPTAEDADNPKRAQIKPGDRLFGVEVSSPVTVVEFFYPEGGTYTFTFRLAASERERGTDASGLRTERISIGSASRMTDPETGGFVEWPSMSVIAVHGPGRDAGWARTAQNTYGRALDEPVAITPYEGARTIALTPAQVQAHVTDVVTRERAQAEAERREEGRTR